MGKDFRGTPLHGKRATGPSGHTRVASVGIDCYNPKMDLAAFLPYRIAVLAESVSRGVAQVYARRFDLSREEWRVLAALGDAGEMKTQAALLTTTLDKMQVSRAVARLERKGFVERKEDAADRRNRILRLTAAGRAAYRRIEPMVLAREAFLLEALDADERRALDRMLEKLTRRARQLEDQG